MLPRTVINGMHVLAFGITICHGITRFRMTMSRIGAPYFDEVRNNKIPTQKKIDLDLRLNEVTF